MYFKHRVTALLELMNFYAETVTSLHPELHIADVNLIKDLLGFNYKK